MRTEKAAERRLGQRTCSTYCGRGRKISTGLPVHLTRPGLARIGTFLQGVAQAEMIAVCRIVCDVGAL